LGRLYLGSIDLPTATGTLSTNVGDLIKRNQLRIFPIDPKTITIVAEAKTPEQAKNTVQSIQARHLQEFREAQARQTKQATQQHRRQISDQQHLQKQYKEAKRKLAEFTAREVREKTLDTAVLALGRKIEKSLGRVQKINEKLATISDRMTRAELEARRPTIRIDPDALRNAQSADPLFSGDLRALKGKHTLYLEVFKQELQAAHKALVTLQKQLKNLWSSVSKQLLLDLPSGLADDLVELNQASELYQDRLEDYQRRWDNYCEKVLELLADPERADYDGVQTLLSQLRQDLEQRCGELPKHLQVLFDRLRRGPKGDARRPGGLSGVTVRNIASSAVQYDLERVLTTWRGLVRHVNRMFPEFNVQLRALGRACRDLQGRMLIQQRRVRQRLEHKYLLTAKRRAREQLLKLQSEFQQTGAELSALCEGLLADQRKLCKLTERWPQWQELYEQMHRLRLELQSSTAALGKAGVEYWSEELEITEPTTVQLSRAGFLADYENPASIAAGIATALLVCLVVRPRRSAG